MNDIKKSAFITEICKTADNMYRLGWDERNGGNMSVILPADEVAAYIDIDIDSAERVLPIDFDASFLSGMIFAVTGTGKYFKNVLDDPENNLGIIRVNPDGKSISVLWGFADGGRPTSELASHFMSHIERLKKDPEHRVVMHTHATNVIAMTFVHDIDDRSFTRTLWKMCTECPVVFPDGVGVLPWMVCGSSEIGEKTAEKMRDYRVVVWAQHGIFGTGRNIDETFGLIETVEKSAKIYMKIAHLDIKRTMTDDNIRAIAKAFSLKIREDFLD